MYIAEHNEWQKYLILAASWPGSARAGLGVHGGDEGGVHVEADAAVPDPGARVQHLVAAHGLLARQLGLHLADCGQCIHTDGSYVGYLISISNKILSVNCGILTWARLPYSLLRAAASSSPDLQWNIHTRVLVILACTRVTCPITRTRDTWHVTSPGDALPQPLLPALARPRLRLRQQPRPQHQLVREVCSAYLYISISISIMWYLDI